MIPALVLLAVGIPIIVILGLMNRGQDLANRALVRFQSPKVESGWHEGQVLFTDAGCTMVWKRDPTVRGGEIGFSLTSLEKLEKKDGQQWVDVPLAQLIEKEPKGCQARASQ